MALLLVSSGVTLAVPFCLGNVIDIINTENKEKMLDSLNRFGAILLGVLVIGGFCNFGRVYLMRTTGYKITQNLRKKAYAAILRQEVAMFDKRSTGELVGRLTEDAQLVSSSVTNNVSDGLRYSVMSVAGISMMVYVSPQLAIVGLSIVPLFAGTAIVYGRFLKKISKDMQNSMAVLNTTAEERITNIRTVKAFAQEIREVEHYDSKLKDVLQLCYKESLYRAIFFGMAGFSGNAIILSVLYYGGLLVTDSSLTIGNLSAFLLYAGYVGMSMSGLSTFYSDLNKALGAGSRLFELIEKEPLIPIQGGRVLESKLSGDIEFQNVSFAYPTRENVWVLKNFSLKIPKCTMTAIVGSSGSGKSTIASLVLRLYDPSKGRILLDNHALTSLDPMWVKSQIGVVSQEPVLFSGTIRDNITYGSENATNHDVEDAAMRAYVSEFIKRMPAGLDTIVGERGISLSGGERQRVAIARALIKKPKILILDEATSALDAESEYFVQEALEKATQGRTVLTIAHRLSTIKNADNIVVLDKGRVAETGSYNQLMALENGYFKRLVQHQTFE